MNTDMSVFMTSHTIWVQQAYARIETSMLHTLLLGHSTVFGRLMSHCCFPVYVAFHSVGVHLKLTVLSLPH